MNMTIEQAKRILEILAKDEKLEKFSSHVFIDKYIEKFESEYIDLLVEEKEKQKQASKNPTDIFRKVHSQIAIFLSDKQDKLGIRHIDDVKDMNIHYRETYCAEWRFESSK